jgi:precorrin-3B C17-methyltransferase
MELLEQSGETLETEVIPGITAALSGAALLGSPLTNDFAVISLSDLLTPWPVIEKRLEGAASGDFVIVLYNPGSMKRREHLKKACGIIMRYRSPDTVCGTVRSIGREGEQIKTLTLAEMRETEVDMLTTVFIGNTSTRVIDGRLVTPRGYAVNRVILIFGGTTEGRILSRKLAERGMKVILCVATEYGEEVVEENENIRIHTGHMAEDEIISLINDIKPAVIFDATHPYAVEITQNVSAAAAAAGVRYERIRRDVGLEATDSEIIYVPDAESAAAILDRTDARAFVSTGSRSASVFGNVHDAEKRITMRILPAEEAVEKCRDAGFKGRNLICMQGPFSTEINEAMFRETASEILVTKVSGKTGGFPEKLEAARRLHMKIIVITPPEDIPGITLEAALNFQL